MDALDQDMAQFDKAYKSGGTAVKERPVKGDALDADMAQFDKAYNKPGEKPSNYDSLISSAASKHGINPNTFRNLVKAESSFNPRARSPKGAMGLTQLMPDTAANVGVTDPYDPAQSVEGGAKYFKGLLDRYHGDERMAVAAYNAGPGAVDKYKGVPPYRETQAYVKRILGNGASPQSTKSPYGGIIAQAEGNGPRFQTQHIKNYVRGGFEQGMGPTQIKVMHPDFAPGAVDHEYNAWKAEKQAKAKHPATGRFDPSSLPTSGTYTAVDTMGQPVTAPLPKSAANTKQRQPQQFIGPDSTDPKSTSYIAPPPTNRDRVKIATAKGGVLAGAKTAAGIFAQGGLEGVKAGAQFVPSVAGQGGKFLAKHLTGFLGSNVGEGQKQAVENFSESAASFAPYIVPVLGEYIGGLSIAGMATDPKAAISGLLEPWKDPISTVRSGKGLDLLTLPIIIAAGAKGARGGGEIGPAEKAAALHEVVDNIVDKHGFTPEEQAQLHTTLDSAINREAPQQSPPAAIPEQSTPQPSPAPNASETQAGGIQDGKRLNARAMREYGTTSVPESVGYITPTGTAIDSSGIKQGSSSQGRNIDHREIAQHALGDNTSESATDDMHRFMSQTGNIRVVGAKNEVNIEILVENGMPSDAQLKRIKSMASGKTIVYDLSDAKGNTIHSGEGDYNALVRDLQSAIKNESQITQARTAGTIPKQLQPIADFINKNNFAPEQFAEVRWNKQNPHYSEYRALLDKSGIGVNKVWGDFGFDGGQGEFYNRVKTNAPETAPVAAVGNADLSKLDLTGSRKVTTKAIERAIKDTEGVTPEEKFQNHYETNALKEHGESMDEFWDRIRCG